MKQVLFLFTLNLVLFSSSCKVNQVNKSTEIADTTQAVQSFDSLVEESIEEAMLPIEPPRTYQASETRNQDLIHTRLELAFDWNKQHVLGTALLELKPYFYPTDSIVLDAKGFDIASVELVDGSNKTVLAYKYDKKQLTIQLGRTYQRNEHYFIEINYTAKPNELTTEEGEAIRDNRGLYFIDPMDTIPGKPTQIWTQGETESSSCWFPTIDSPNERCTQEIYLTVDTTYTTLSNGKLVYQKDNGDGTRTDYWKMDMPHAPYLFMLAIGNYAVVDDSSDDLLINYYVEPEYAPYADRIFIHTPEMIAFFSDTLNLPFPWVKYSQVVVRDFVSGAMENTTASTFFEDIQRDSRAMLDQEYETIVAHELFHQWFGDYVTCESWANLPLNESFANYGEFIWLDHRYGTDRSDAWRISEIEEYLLEAETEIKPLIRYYYQNRGNMFDRHSYNKGGQVLHMLRHQVGDAAFFASLHHYLEKNKLSAVEIHDLRLAFEEVTGSDLNWFFDQWFLQKGHPQLSVRHQFTDSTGILRLTVEQTQNTEEVPVYELPTELAIWVNGEKTVYPVLINDTYHEWEFGLEGSPDLVMLDPDHVMLAETDHVKDFDMWLYQYRNIDRYFSKYQAMLAMAGMYGEDEVEKMAEIMFEALDHNYYEMRVNAIDFFSQYEGKDSVKVAATMKQLALDDSHADVRASALGYLDQWEVPGRLDIYLQATRDSSYQVLTNALFGLFNTDLPLDSLHTTIEEFSDLKNGSVSLAVAYHYMLNQIPGKYKWFDDRVYHIDEGSLYYFLSLYAQYVLTQAPFHTDETLATLEYFARHYDSPYVRAMAINSMSYFSETPGVEALLREIIEDETDQRVMDYLMSQSQ